MVNCITVIKQRKGKILCRVLSCKDKTDYQTNYFVANKEFKSTIANINLGKTKINLNDLGAKLFPNITLAIEEFVKEEK